MTDAIRQGVLYARQPIYNRRLELAGFELLFRPIDSSAPTLSELDGDRATSQVLLNAFTATDIGEVCEGQPAFVNFTAETLSHHIPFDPATIVIEVLETVTPSDSTLAALQTLHQRGYTIALDDYVLTDSNHPFLPWADIVKLEYPAYDAGTLRATVAQLHRYNPKLRVLAEKIESHQEFQHCRDAGCDLFQGYFLARPEAVHGSIMPINRLSALSVLAELNRPRLGIHEMSRLIRNDPFLSLRLLRLAQSALYQRSQPITSLEGAVMSLGLNRIRGLASLLVLSQLDDKPHALQRLAILRGHFCQRLTEHLPGLAEMGFTTGLFSCLDSLFDQPLDDIIAQVPLHEEIRAALLTREGPLGLVLETALLFEQDRWAAIDWPRLDTLNLDAIAVAEAYDSAIALMHNAT
ncbi:EAL and modified HD-GYP domain-containing signal transduction protein [Kushneria sinocarnis]|uniref:EAL and modified HD-GYP domain-containing signal transduction protein n=1 Tax=Kushneria sinocarnis TaxID=595502 RepID=A0A420WU18_9GAMM|nr:HDOD domain-containing protein [Kushneria sinocarnis]RKQ96935.1 EAL and modified HD-GYP domain-containing signal transduction protein [Kushneria sinocarnis]